MAGLKTLLPTGLKARLRRLIPRRFHAFCVGAPRTGTTTIRAMLEHNYRAAHEPEPEALIQLAIDAVEEARSPDEIREELRERDKRLHLELESSHPLAYVVEHLPKLFPDARFIITIREPHSWLRSRLMHHRRAQGSPLWHPYRDYFLHRRQGTFAPEERSLEELGLCSLNVYLTQYVDHYTRVFGALADRSPLVLKTPELDGSAPILAAFLGIDPATILPAHKNRTSGELDPLSDIDPEFTRSRVWQDCRALIEEHFPEHRADYG